jgi:Flp pilus assembly protein TadD
MSRIFSKAVGWQAMVCVLAASCALVMLPAKAEPYETNPDAAARDPDYAAGKQAMAMKNWPEAAKRFAKAAAGDPDNPDLQNYLGHAYRQLKDFDSSFRHYKRALALDPRHRGAHEYIGEAYLMLGDVKSAEKHLAVLREICLLSCEELEDLQKAISLYRAKH